MSHYTFNSLWGLASLALLGIDSGAIHIASATAQIKPQTFENKPIAIGKVKRVKIPRGGITEVKMPVLTPEQQAQRETFSKKISTLVDRESDKPLHRIGYIIQEVKPFLKHADPFIRIETLRIYQRFGSVLLTNQADDIIPLLHDQDKEVRTIVSYALAEMKERARAAVPKLKLMLHDPVRDPDVLVAAQWGLQNIDQMTRTKRLKELLQQLQSTNPGQPRYHAVLELGNMFAIELRPQLEKLRNHPNATVRQDAISVLTSITVYQERQNELRKFQ
jgi:hypothetical protein